MIISIKNKYILYQIIVMNEIVEICQVLNYDSMNINELNEKLNKECENIGRIMYKFTKGFNDVGDNLNACYYRDQRQDIYLETDFNNIECLEYELDQLFFNYKKIKGLIKDVRLGKLILKNKRDEESEKYLNMNNSKINLQQ